MTSISRLGLGCMGMNLSNRERSIETVHYALSQGITLLNTGEFYNCGESEMVLREALSGVPRDSYFLSVKFGVLPLPGRGIYGLDVNPFHVKAHLAYSLHRLGLEYVDLLEPARMDEDVPVEELMGALQECVKEGYVRHLGLTQLSAENLKRAAAVCPLHTIELDYSLANRSIETNGVLDAARACGAGVLAFGVLAHGVLSDHGEANMAAGASTPEAQRENALAALKKLAEAHGVSLEILAQAYVYAKHPDMSVLIGTTSKEHLQTSIDALQVTLTQDDLARIEAAFPAGQVSLGQMRNFIFRNGRVVQS